MQRPTAIDVPLDWVVDALFPDFEAGGDPFSSSYARTGAELVIACADLLQEHAFPESEGAWGEARPACRGHRHPAKPAVVDGEAWWICPTTEQRLALIGEYEHPVDRRTRRKRRGERRSRRS